MHFSSSVRVLLRHRLPDTQRSPIGKLRQQVAVRFPMCLDLVQHLSQCLINSLLVNICLLVYSNRRWVLTTGRFPFRNDCLCTYWLTFARWRDPKESGFSPHAGCLTAKLTLTRWLDPRANVFSLPAGAITDMLALLLAC